MLKAIGVMTIFTVFIALFYLQEIKAKQHYSKKSKYRVAPENRKRHSAYLLFCWRNYQRQGD